MKKSFALVIFSYVLSACGGMSESVTDLSGQQPVTPGVGAKAYAPGFRVSTGSVINASSTSMKMTARLGKIDRPQVGVDQSSATIKAKTGMTRHMHDD